MKHSARVKRSSQPIIFAALSLVGIAGVVGGLAGTGALFTDSQSLAGNSFSTGTLSLTPAKTGSSELSIANMAPGDVQYGQVTVTNSGSLGLRYAVTQSSTNEDGKDLASGLKLAVKAGQTSCDDAGWASGTLLSEAGSTLASSNVFGSPAQGAQAGDRTLAAGTNEKLCFRVELPLDAPNAVQGATTTATFVFAAEQTKNN